MIGKLVGTLGLEQQAAATIAAFIMSGGVYAAAAMWPFLAPFIVTIKGVAAIMGISGVIGF